LSKVSRELSPLLQVHGDGRGRIPCRWLESLSQLGERLSVNGVRLGALEQRFGKIVSLSGIDDTDDEPGLDQGDC